MKTRITLKASMISAILLGIFAPICFMAGLVLYNFIYHNAYSAALGWLLYFLPLTFLGGLVIGAIQGVMLAIGYRRARLKPVWICFSISAIIASILNAFWQIWTVGILTLVCNFIIAFIIVRLFLHSPKPPLARGDSDISRRGD